MSKHQNILDAIDNLTERVLQIASDLETLKELVGNESITARIEITNEEVDCLLKGDDDEGN